jgi:hypothetical protein
MIPFSEVAPDCVSNSLHISSIAINSKIKKFKNAKDVWNLN